MKKFNVLNILSESIVHLNTTEGNQVWCKANMTKKKIGKPCWECKESIGKEAYSPITNKSNRMERICLNCIEKAKTLVR